MRDQEAPRGRPVVNTFGGHLTKGMVDTILAMCDNGLRISLAAEELGVCHSSISRQLERIEQRTGLRCQNFFDAIELYNICWDKYPGTIEAIAKERFVGKRVPMKYIP